MSIFVARVPTATRASSRSFTTSIFQRGPGEAKGFGDTLKKDHQEFRRLYQDYKNEKNYKEKQKIANELIRGISIHDVIEERFLYPAFQEVVEKKGKETADHSRQEHQQVKELLYKIDNKGVDETDFDKILDNIMNNLEHHMKEEEQKIFPQLKERLGEAGSVELGNAIDEARSSSPTHPHPSAPDTPPGLTAAGMVAGPLDKLRDLGRDFAGASKESKNSPDKQ